MAQFGVRRVMTAAQAVTTASNNDNLIIKSNAHEILPVVTVLMLGVGYSPAQSTLDYVSATITKSFLMTMMTGGKVWNRDFFSRRN